MIIETQDIRKQLEDIWPWFKTHKNRIEFWDFKYYWAIPEMQVGQLIAKSSVPDMIFIPEFNDCDDFSLQAQAETRRKRYLAYIRAREEGEIPEDLKHPAAVAMAHGNMWRGQSKNHKANLFVCDEGIYLADFMPMEKRHWKATAKNDNLFKINFA